jgi:hypothetical protein
MDPRSSQSRLNTHLFFFGRTFVLVEMSWVGYRLVGMVTPGWDDGGGAK